MKIELTETEVKIIKHSLRIFINLHTAFNFKESWIREPIYRLEEKLETYTYPQIIDKYFPKDE